MELKDYTTEELRAELKKRNAEERAILNLEYERDFLGNDLSENMVRRAYIKGCYEQKAIDLDKSCNIFCHIGCPHKKDSYDCLNDKCDTWKIFRKMMEE